MKPRIVWHKQGEGKTRIALKILIDLNLGPSAICLVVCRRKAFYSWRQEILKVGINAQVNDYKDSTTPFSKVRQTIWLVSHAMLHKILIDLNDCPIKFLVFDELYLYSNSKSQRSKAAKRLCDTVLQHENTIIGLSGTIMPAKDNLSIWGQCSAVGIASALAPNLTEFYQTYKRSFLVDFHNGQGQITQWVNAPNSYQRIMDRLKPYVHMHFPKGARLIKESFQEYDLTNPQRKLIEQLKDEYYAYLEEHNMELELRSALELISKVSQISNGYVRDMDGRVARIASYKLDGICAKLEEIHDEGERCVVWCYFVHDLNILSEALAFKSIKMSGQHEFDIDAWDNRDANIVLATIGSGSSVNYFNQVQFAKYFSLSFKWLDFEQSKMRHDRYDSTHSTCHYEYYFTKNTFDRHIYKTVVGSGKLEQSVITSWLNQVLKK